MSTYPFTAILGQSAMQTALLLCAVDPGLGGVLLRGQKGTAKSTAARALADLLPPVAVVSGCPFHCDPAQRDDPAPCCHNRQAAGETLYSELIPTPFVDLPLSATEDRLVGALNLEKTLQTGLRQFEPGLLATAHRGILYVDEVNLLPDHLVDLLLDVAASGVNRVEREGLRYSHAARFLLVGTMNPEEGELRPQFLDRFGLCVTISGLSDRQLRYDVVMQSLAFDRDPDAFLADFQDLETIAREQVVRARQQLQEVDLPVAVIERAVDLAAGAGTQGHRAELALVRAARAHAALLGRDSVTLADLAEVAGFALAHRLPGAPGQSAGQIDDRIASLLQEHLADKSARCNSDSKEAATGEDLLLDDMNFPGSAAAGSMLFTYLKKKRQTAFSTPMKPSI